VPGPLQGDAGSEEGLLDRGQDSRYNDPWSKEVVVSKRARAVAVTVLFLSSGVAHADPTIDVVGECRRVSVRIGGMTPWGDVTVFIGRVGGTTTLTHGPCAGTILDLVGANAPDSNLWSNWIGSDGALILRPSMLGLGDLKCAQGVQAIDLTTCEVTPALPLRP
jgi:hypothetical protein